MLLKIPVPKRIAGRGIWTQRRFLNSEPPEAHIVDWVRQTLNAGDTFFDIGAHYGWISIAAAGCVGRSGRVVAFEASPALINVLEYHKRLNRLHQMEIVPRAVTNVSDISVPFFMVNGGLSFRNSLTTGGDDVPYLADNEKSRVDVRSISLDNFYLESGLVPTVIKIDVEGAELLVLQGAERILSEFSPVLIVGVHPYWLPKPQRAADILDFLRQHGYEIRKQHIVDFDGSYLADYLCAANAGITSESRSRPSRVAI